MISVLPNAITLSRLLSVPFLAIMLSSNDYLLAFWFFLALGLSDGLDGFLAQKHRFQSESLATASRARDIEFCTYNLG